MDNALQQSSIAIAITDLGLRQSLLYSDLIYLL